MFFCQRRTGWTRRTHPLGFVESAVLMSKYIFKRPRRAQLAYWAACTQIGILAPRTQESAEAVEEGMLDQDADGFQADADSEMVETPDVGCWAGCKFSAGQVT